MATVFRGLSMILGVVLGLLGLAFMLVPDLPMARLGLLTDSAMGLSFLRGDAGGSLVLVGGVIVWGAWLRDARLLIVPMVWFVLLSVGRVIGIMGDADGLSAAPLLVADLAALGLLWVTRASVRRLE